MTNEIIGLQSEFGSWVFGIFSEPQILNGPFWNCKTMDETGPWGCPYPRLWSHSLSMIRIAELSEVKYGQTVEAGRGTLAMRRYASFGCRSVLYEKMGISGFAQMVEFCY